MTTKAIGIEKCLFVIAMLESMSVDYLAVKAAWGNIFGMFMAAFPLFGKLTQIGTAIPQIAVEVTDLEAAEIGQISAAFFKAIMTWKNAILGKVPV
jgi:hypothetical protein